MRTSQDVFTFWPNKRRGRRKKRSAISTTDRLSRDIIRM